MNAIREALAIAVALIIVGLCWVYVVGEWCIVRCWRLLPGKGRR